MPRIPSEHRIKERMDKNMKTIKTMADLKMLQEKGELSKAYMNFLEEYFLQLFESFGEGEDLDSFRLERDGYIVILGPRDNLRELRNVGFKDGGLFGTFPEYIEKETLTDGKQLWKIALFHGSGAMQIFFSQIGELDAEAEVWMEEHYKSDELISEEFLPKTTRTVSKDEH